MFPSQHAVSRGTKTSYSSHVVCCHKVTEVEMILTKVSADGFPFYFGDLN
jgi:hypothetical protein